MMEAGTSGMVLNHLLFQKAIIDEGDRSEKIDPYLGLLAQAEAGNEMVPSDPIDRSAGSDSFTGHGRSTPFSKTRRRSANRRG